MFLSPCSCSKTDNFWYNKPCDTATPQHPLTRHGRSAQNTELKTTIGQLIGVQRNLSDLYKLPAKRSKLQITWLNIKKEVENMTIASKRQAKTKEMLKYQFRVLQKFGFAMERLRDWKISTASKAFKEKDRIIIYTNAIDYLKKYMCEVHEKLNKQQMSSPRLPKLKTKIKTSYTDIKSTDTNFFKRLLKFLRKVRKIMRNEKRRRKNTETSTRKV